MPAQPQFLHLTTTGRRSGLPRRIEIWFTERDGRYYLIAEHGDRAQWVQNLKASSRAEWTVGQSQFRGNARVLDREKEPDLFRDVQELSREKYGWGEGLVVELAPDIPISDF